MNASFGRWFAVWAGVAAFVLAVLFLMPWSCLDIEGVSSWERCSSAMGTPAFSVDDWGLDSDLNVLIPILSGVVVGFVAWWFRRAKRTRR